MPKKQQPKKALNAVSSRTSTNDKRPLTALPFIPPIPPSRRFFVFGKKISNRSKRYIGALSLALIIVIGLGIVLTKSKLFAATFTWTQSAWTGGQTANTATHPTNETGWTEYNTKDSNISAGASVSLALSSSAKTDTSDTDFNSGTKTSTVVNGSGSGAWIEASSSEGAGATLSVIGVSGGLFASKTMVYEPVTDSTWYIGTYAAKSPQLVQYAGDGTNGTALGAVDLSTYSVNGIYYTPVYDSTTQLLWVLGASGSGIDYKLISINPATRAVVNTYTVTGAKYSTNCGFFLYDAALDAFWISSDAGAGPKIWKVNKTGVIQQTIAAPASPWCQAYAAYADSGTSAIYFTAGTGTTLYKQPKDGSAATSATLGGSANTTIAYDPITPAIWTANKAATPNGQVNKVLLSNLSVTSYVAAFTNGVNSIAYDAYHQQMIVSEFTNSTAKKVRLTDGVASSFAALGVSAGLIMYEPTHRVLWSGFPVVTSFVTYSSSGNFASQIIDTTTSSTFGTVSWTSSVPTNTTLAIKVRTSNSPTMVGAPAWSGCTAITSGQNMSTGGCATNGHRYVQYSADFTTSQTSVTAKLSDITLNYSAYTNGTLTSSIYNTNDASNVVARLAWTSTGTGTVKFQLRTSPDGNSWTSWFGPTGTGDYYTDNTGGQAINSANHDSINDQYVQYKAFLISADGSSTPTLTGVTATYVVNAPPEFQAAPTAVQNADGTVTISYSIRDTDTSTDTGSVGLVTPSFEYSIDNGAHWATIASGLPAGATTPKSVDGSSYTNYTVTWTAKTTLNGTYAAQTKIRVTVNDLQAANATAQSTTSAFALDVKNPTLGVNPIIVDASSTPAHLTLNASDDTSLQMCLSLDNTQTHCTAYNSSSTIALETDPDTIFVIYRDGFGNTSSASTISPVTPNNLVIRDISNPPTNEYQLFLTWAATSLPTNQFSQYIVYQSGTGINGSYTQATTIADKTINYFLHKNLTGGSTHYYRIATVDATGNVSYLSTAINGTANGQGGGTDVVPPTISHVTVSAITTQSATVTWDTDELSNTTIGYSTTPAQFNTEVGVATMVDHAGGVGAHTIILNGLTPNTTYYLRVKSADPSGNIASDTNGGDGYIFSTVSGPTISTVTTTSIENTTATISWETNTASDSTVMYSTNLQLSTPTSINSSTLTTSHSVLVSGLTLGTKYYYEVKSGVAVDTNGGQYYSFTTTQDASAPTISGVRAGPVTDTQAVITWATDEKATAQVFYGTTPGSHLFETTLDSNLNLEHAATLTGLTAHQTYYYTVASVDASGNTTTSPEQQFTTLYQLVEQTPTNIPPVISGITAAPVIDTQAVIQWTTDTPSTTRVDYGTSAGHLTSHVGPDSTLNKSHAITIANLSAHTTYVYTVTSVDVWGNASTSAEQSFTTVYQLVEQTPTSTGPVISAITIEPLTDTTAVIRWVTDTLSSTQLFYGTTAGTYPTSTTIDASLNLGHQVTLTGLTANTKYVFVVTSTDRWGNSTTSVEQSFTTTQPLLTLSQVNEMIDAIKNGNKPDTTPAILSSISVVDVTDHGASISWTSDEPANSFVQFGTTALDQVVYGNWVYSSDHRIDLGSLTPKTTYTYRVVSAEIHGNIAVSPTATFTTLETPTSILVTQLQQQVHDIQNTAQSLPGPVIGGQPKVDVTPTWAVISWTTDTPANSLISYGSDVEYAPHHSYAQTVGDPQHYVVQHAVKVSNLSENTLYHFQITSTSEVGQASVTTDATFTTSKKTFAIDNYSVDTPDTQTAIFRWTTNDTATSLIHVTPYLNNILAVDQQQTFKDSTSSLIHQVTASALEPGVRYNVELVSTNGSKIQVSKIIPTFSTSGGGQPPVISQIHIDSALSPGQKVKVQTIISWNTDIPSTSQVFYRAGVAQANAGLTDSSSLDPSFTKHHVVVMTNFEPGSVYQLKVESKNSNGQVATSKNLTTLMPQQEQTVFQVITNTFTQVFGWTRLFNK